MGLEGESAKHNRYTKRKKVASLLQTYDNDRSLYVSDQKIKSEPKDKTPPYLPQYGEQWPIAENLQALMAGPSNNIYAQQDMWAGQSFVQLPSVSPNVQPVSPPMHMAQNLQVLTSNVPAMSPNMQPMSPNMQPMSPNMQVMSPHGQQIMSPHHAQTMSPHHAQTMSPHHAQSMSPHHAQTMSPHANLQVMSPQHAMGRISPNVQHQQTLGSMSPNLVQQVPHVQQTNYAQIHQQMETDTQSNPSLSNLLLDRGEALTLNSGELSGLLGSLGE